MGIVSPRTDDEARDLFARFGPMTDPTAVSFANYPAEEEWLAALTPQCIPQVTAHDAAYLVMQAWQ